ncbi:MAG: RNA polymerase sigma-70 factor [Tepidiformaceae bacterium]
MTTAEMTAAATAFEQHRPLLFGIAYRMLSSVVEAEDVVQDAFLRFRTSNADELRSPRSYLVTIVTRLSLDVLRSARIRREDYVGEWLPEPLPTFDGRGPGSPEETVERDESLSMAFLVLLERLGAVERAVFLLREVFDYDYREIADIMGKSEVACRQVFRRARQRLGEDHRPAVATPAEVERVLSGLVEALTFGDVATVVSLLTSDVVATSDGGGVRRGAINPIHGRDHVAKFMLGGVRLDPLGSPLRVTIEFVELNGAPAIISRDADGTATEAAIVELDGGRIVRLFSVRNPAKLAALSPGLPSYSVGSGGRPV